MLADGHGDLGSKAQQDHPSLTPSADHSNLHALPLPRMSRLHILEAALSRLSVRVVLQTQHEGHICDTFIFMITQTPSFSSVELAEALNTQIRHSLGKTSPPIWSTYKREGGHYQLKISWPKAGAAFPTTNLGIKEVRRLGKEDPLSLYLGDHSSGVHAYLPFHQVSSLLIGGGEHVEQNVGLDIVLTNLVYQASPKNLRLIVVDPMSETSPFHGLPHLYSPILDEEECISEAFRGFFRECSF